MKRALSIIVLLSVASCGSSSNFDPQRYGTVHVALAPATGAPPVSDTTTMMVTEVMADLRVLGPDFQTASDPSTADLVIDVDESRCVFPSWSASSPHTFGASSACPEDRTLYKAAIARAFEQYLGMQLICRGDGSDPPPSSCSPVGTGPAVMNPQPTDPNPTALDIREFQRQHP